MDVVEKFAGQLFFFILTCIGSGVVAIITLKILAKQLAKDIEDLKSDSKADIKDLHDRITKKDDEHARNTDELRGDIKMMLVDLAKISGFINGLKSGGTI